MDQAPEGETTPAGQEEQRPRQQGLLPCRKVTGEGLESHVLNEGRWSLLGDSGNVCKGEEGHASENRVMLSLLVALRCAPRVGAKAKAGRGLWTGPPIPIPRPVS